ncbi:MAG: hypothetical protein FWD78_10115 [Treponema sp.]|nr:hypothetical protein [Treponema sp.]
MVKKAAGGESFIIANAGKPMVKVIPYSPKQSTQKRIGFLKGIIKVPDDFDRMGQDEIIKDFEA